MKNETVRISVGEGLNQAFLLDESRKYLKKMFDLEVEEAKEEADLTFLLREEEGADHIRIHFKDGQGEISANTPVGVIIAFYRFLNEKGARFLRPGEDNEHIPALKPETFYEDLELDERASFKHRGVCIEGADSEQNIVDFLDWLPKIGMNSFFVQFENPYSFLKRWYEHEFNPYMEKEPFSNDIAQEMSDRIDEQIEKRGLVHHRVGHGWTGEVLGYSSKYGWESGLEIDEEKKPYVALVDGKRELIQGAPILTSLDFAHPDISRMMADSVVAYAKEHPEVDYLHVWLSDARNNICECEKCQKELVSDQYIRILNEMDEALEAAGLDTKICFLLYHELLFAPQKESIKNPDRFTMMFAPITRTFEKSYKAVDYDQLPEPKGYIRNQIQLPNSLEENLSYLFDWKKQFKGDSFVYDYPLGRAHYGDLGYMKISKTIYDDIAFLDELGLDGYISCQELRAGFPHHFPNYVMGAMLWDNTRDYEALKREYFEALLGEDYQQAVSYLEKLSKYSSCDHFNAIGEREDPVLAGTYQLCVSLAEEAISLIENGILNNDGMTRENWIQIAYHRDYVVRLADALRLLAEGKNQQAQKRWREVLDFIRRNESVIQPNLDVYRVIEVAKNYAGFLL